MQSVRNWKQQLARRGSLAITWNDNADLVSAKRRPREFAQRQRLYEPRKTSARANLADYFFYDPAGPVQSLGGHSCCYPQSTPMGPMIQRDVELRNDVLVYSSEPLERPLWVAGNVTARLFAATSARDTDWVVKLCDVAPDGRSVNIQEGVIRARFRNGFDQATLLEPDSDQRVHDHGRRMLPSLRGRPSHPHPGNKQQFSGDRPQPQYRRSARHGRTL